MGSSESKLAEKLPETTNLDEQESIPSTPILTPKLFRQTTDKNGLDPRSPSKHIARTPIELLSAAADKLTLNNEDATTPKETSFKKHIVLGVDPRSPTLEIQRTPIIVTAIPDEKLLNKIRNKNLEKVLKCALVNTPQNKSVPPKLLESSPVTARPKSDVYKRKSLVLLETNIDFTETNLDDVIKKKYLGKSLQNLSLSDEIAYEVTDPRSPTIEFLRTPIQICEKVDRATKVEADRGLLVKNESEDDNIKELCIRQSEEVIKVNMDKPISIAGPPNLETILPINEDCMPKEVTEKQIVDQALILLVGQEISQPQEGNKHNLMTEDILAEPLLDCTQAKVGEVIISTSSTKLSPNEKKQTVVPSPILKQNPHLIRSAPVSPPSVVSITPKKSKSQPITPPLINLTADVKELDKKLTHLIYEDEDLVVCPRVVKIKEQNRTPLGLRNGNDNKKSTQKLKVSDKPRKAEYVVSKIPVFKDKKIKVQCENTPPRSMIGGTNRSSKWDAKDDTLVI